MSSIVVQGDTSGSVILEAPAVAGTVTVTLPATSGTMAVSGASQSFTDVTATGNLTVDGNTILGNASTDTLNVGNGGLVKDASGNVGIGTSSPAYKLDVSGVVSSNDTVRVTSGTTVTIMSTAGGGEGVVGTSSNHALQFRTNNTERMRLDASGRLLIGGTSTYDFNGQANLVVNGTANNATITIASTDTGYLAFADGTSGTDRYTGSIQYLHSSNAMLFSTNGGVERARITNTGILRLVSNQLQLSSGDIGIAVVNGTGMLNAAFSFTFNVANQGSVFVFAAFNHYGLISSYGCSRLSACSVGTGGGSEVNISNQTTATGGSWTFSPSVSTMTITHNAGNYNANGLYTIIVIGNSVSI